MIIGITGKQGSGKTTVANYIAQVFGGNVIHGDELAHEVLTLDVYNYVLSWFNQTPEDKVDRKRLGSFLFKDKELMDKYNDLIYSLMHFEERFQKQPDGIFVIDWNFLPITPLMDKCDITILLDAPESIREERIINRDNVQSDYFKLREANALDYKAEDFDFFLTSDEILSDESVLKKILEVK